MYCVNKDASPRPTVTQDAKNFCRYSTNALAQYIVTVSHDTVRRVPVHYSPRGPDRPVAATALAGGDRALVAALEDTTRLHPLGNASRA